MSVVENPELQVDGGQERPQAEEIWDSIPGRGHSQCKGPEEEVCLWYARTLKEAGWLEQNGRGGQQ